MSDHKLLGVDVSHPQGVDLSDLTSNKLSLVSTLNAETLLLAEKDVRFRSLLCQGVTTLDGFWTFLAFKKKFPDSSEVIKQSGSKLIFEIAQFCAANGVKVLLLGGDELVNAKAIQKLGASKSKFVVGYSPKFEDYPFSVENRNAIRECVTKNRPDFIVTAFGAPKQEFWAADETEFLQQVGVKAVFFLGGAVDVVAGKFLKAPVWIQYLGLESLWRLIQAPSRFKREVRKLRFLSKLLRGNY